MGKPSFGAYLQGYAMSRETLITFAANFGLGYAVGLKPYTAAMIAGATTLANVVSMFVFAPPAAYTGGDPLAGNYHFRLENAVVGGTATGVAKYFFNVGWTNSIILGVGATLINYVLYFVTAPPASFMS